MGQRIRAFLSRSLDSGLLSTLLSSVEVSVPFEFRPSMGSASILLVIVYWTVELLEEFCQLKYILAYFSEDLGLLYFVPPPPHIFRDLP